MQGQELVSHRRDVVTAKALETSLPGQAQETLQGVSLSSGTRVSSEVCSRMLSEAVTLEGVLELENYRFIGIRVKIDSGKSHPCVLNLRETVKRSKIFAGSYSVSLQTACYLQGKK